MQGQTKKRSQALCEQLADERDPARLVQLVHEINRLVAEKEERLKQHNAARRACDVVVPLYLSRHTQVLQGQQRLFHHV